MSNAEHAIAEARTWLNVAAPDEGTVASAQAYATLAVAETLREMLDGASELLRSIEIKSTPDGASELLRSIEIKSTPVDLDQSGWAGPQASSDTPANHPDDGHVHQFTCRFCGVDPTPPNYSLLRSEAMRWAEIVGQERSEKMSLQARLADAEEALAAQKAKLIEWCDQWWARSLDRSRHSIVVEVMQRSVESLREALGLPMGPNEIHVTVNGRPVGHQATGSTESTD